MLNASTVMQNASDDVKNAFVIVLNASVVKLKAFMMVLKMSSDCLYWDQKWFQLTKDSETVFDDGIYQKKKKKKKKKKENEANYYFHIYTDIVLPFLCSVFFFSQYLFISMFLSLKRPKNH